MAIDTTIYSPTDFRFAIAEESTFGTEITTQTNFYEIHLTENPQLDYSGLIQDETKRSDGSRVPTNKDIYRSTTGMDTVVPVSGILTDQYADLLLYGAMQDLVSEAAATPYLKEFEWDSSTDGDHSGVPYISYTLNGSNPATDEDWSVKGAVLRKLTITADPTANGGRASFSAEFYSGYAPTQTGLTVTPASWHSPGTNYYQFQSLTTKTIDGSDVVATSFSVDFSNNAVRIDPSSTPGTYYFGSFDVTGNLTVKYGPNTKDLIDKFLLSPTGGSAESTIIMLWGDGTSDGTLKFDLNAIYTGNEMNFGDTGVMVNLPIKGVYDGTNEAVDVQIANDIDRTW